MRWDNPKFHPLGSKFYLSKEQQFQRNSNYYLYFTSLIAPSFQANEHGHHLKIRDSDVLPRTSRLKRSYLLLSWFVYLLDTSSTDRFDRVTKLALLPARRSLYTLQKAPMAHKTNSKEQFMFRFYSFKFSTSATVPVSWVPSSVNQSLAVFYLVRRNFPAFETNLLFLKYYQVSIGYLDSRYFSLFEFSRSRVQTLRPPRVTE